MDPALKQALSLFIIGCIFPSVSSFGIFESSVLAPSLSSGIFENLSTQSPWLLEVDSICKSEVPLDFSFNFHLIASATEVSQAPKILDMYLSALKERPYSTKIITGIIIALIGDAIAQKRQADPYDVKRAAAFAAFDGCYRAVQQLTYPPIIAEFQGQHIIGVLGSLGYTSLPASSAVLGPLEQTLFSQLVIIPTIYYPVFFTITGIIQGLSPQETIERAKTTFVPLMKRNLLFWIPVQFVAFAYIPQDQQISVLIVCGLVWTIILSVSAGAVKGGRKEGDSTLLPEAGISEINEDTESLIIMKEYESGKAIR